MLLNLKNLASKGLCNTICPWMWSIVGAGSTRPNCSSLMHLCPAVLFCSSALLLSTDDSQPPFQFLLRLAIAARSEQLGCQSAISCLVPTCEIIWRNCATNILLCCNYLYWNKVNHALCCLFAIGNKWQSYCVDAVCVQICTYATCGHVTMWQSWSWSRRTGMLSLCIWQYVARRLCGNPGREEEGCPSLNTLPPPHKLPQPAQTSFVSSTEKSAAYINWKIYSDYHLWKQFCLYLDELTQVFPPTLGNLDHSQTWSTSETHYPAHRYITLLPLITLSWQE